jgi:putative heme iron utilization protein
MNRHAGPPTHATAPSVPEPTHAEAARTLTHLGRAGTLATVSRRHPGHPFASLMPYALDAQGRPLVLVSSMAMHTQNLAADPRASLLVVQETAGDPLAAGRVTLMGEMKAVLQAEREPVKAAYLARHANAAYWVDFDDFAFWRLEPTDVYYVGGFGSMGWVEAAEYGAAEPDPLALVSESILVEVNQEHAPALLTHARLLTGEPAEEAALVAVDRRGFKLRVRAGQRVHALRVAFPSEVTTAEQCRKAFTEMLRGSV